MATFSLLTRPLALAAGGQLVETGQRSWTKEGLLRFIFKLRPRMSGAWTVPLESGEVTQLSHRRSGGHSLSGGGQYAFRWVLKILTLWQLLADNYKDLLKILLIFLPLSSSWNYNQAVCPTDSRQPGNHSNLTNYHETHLLHSAARNGRQLGRESHFPFFPHHSGLSHFRNYLFLFSFLYLILRNSKTQPTLEAIWVSNVGPWRKV